MRLFRRRRASRQDRALASSRSGSKKKATGKAKDMKVDPSQKLITDMIKEKKTLPDGDGRM